MQFVQSADALLCSCLSWRILAWDGSNQPSKRAVRLVAGCRSA